MSKIYNYIPQMVSLSPLDFNYQYGSVNDNSPDKFRCDNISILDSSYIASNNDLYNNQSSSSDIYEFGNILSDPFYEEEKKVIGLDSDTVTSYDIYQKKLSSISITNVNILSALASSFLGSIGSIKGNYDVDNGYKSSDVLFSILTAGYNVYMLIQNWNTYSSYLNKHAELISEKITAMNEQIQANNEFMANQLKYINDKKLKSVSVR